MATDREKKMATGTKAPAKPVEPEAQGDQAEGVDVAALQAEAAEAHAMAAEALEQGKEMLAAAMKLVGQASAAPAGQHTVGDIEPAKNDPRRNIRIEGEDFEPVVFRSKGANQRIVRVPATRWTTLNGEAQHAGGIAYDFAPGRGELVALNSDVADFIRGRPAFNLEVWEVGNEPHSAPDPALVMAKATDAAFELDLDKLEELRAIESASHNRKVVLDHIAHCVKKAAGN